VADRKLRIEPASNASSGQALNAFLGMNELAVSSHHLLGAEWNLFHWPAIPIDRTHTNSLQFHRGSQQPGCSEVGIVDEINIEDLVVLAWCCLVQDQVAPNLGLQGIPAFLPGERLIGGAGCKRFILVRASQWTHQGAIERLASFLPCSGRKLRRAVKFLARRNT